MGSTDGAIITTALLVFFVPIVIGVAVEIGLAFLCAHIAKGKGNSPAGWFILGLFFGVIALIIICCEPEKTVINKPGSQNNGGAGQNVNFNQNQGYQQNQGFNQNQDGIAATNGVNQNVKWRCNNCGYMNDPRARDCVICNRKRNSF